MPKLIGRRKDTSKYEDLSDHNVGPSSIGTSSGRTNEEPDIELTSVSVIPDDTYTVTQAVNAFGFGKFQVKLSFFTGICWMADSMEMTILSILSPALHCTWHISRYQEALTTTVVFLGMMLSSTFWGNLSDKYGRKTALTLCAYLLFWYGLLSAASPNYIWLLGLRGMVGFAIGCVPQSVTLYAEFLPTKQRAKCVVLLDCFWALGACVEVLLALFIMPTLGWKWLLAISTAPLLAFVICCPLLPESARFHVASGQQEKALETLQRVAKENGKPMLLGRLVVEGTSPSSQRGRIQDLLGPDLRKTSILLWFIWLTSAFCYYGLVLMTTELFQGSQNSAKKSESCAADCKELTTTDYIDLLWTTLAEFPGILVTIFIIERFGRRKTMTVQHLVFSFCVFFILFATSEVLLTVILFAARGIIAGVFQAAYVYTPEVYPTPLRSVGVGSCSAMARLGAMITPYIAQVLVKTSLLLTVTVYGLAAISAAVASYFLPYETSGKEMRETIHGRN
ncbi:sugar transporter, putative [Pediculus humanus corporis]|uniref:Sugar transporter, putative n=1 Tax=Pediculus humanus subsp. corporis TaxID=121224 RepID=E0VGL6_PEDHC|nr:sugar transporter, putative [Pediculus humanus corporis]EEB12522.1 sugar transporter, putative [Pediculus humanus corporis]